VDLVRTADIVLDNYRPGVLDRLGAGWESLREVNPQVSSVSITGFGDGGPLGDEPGFDPVLQAMSGMMASQGGDSDPVFFTVPVNDVMAAATVAFGSGLALLHRSRTGRGQRVTTSLAAMSAFVQAEALVQFPGRPAAPVGGRDHPGHASFDRYHRAADGWVRVQADDAAALSAVTGGRGIDTWIAGRTRFDAVRDRRRAGRGRRAGRLRRPPP
jgi:crotonobetainyl-CoA:carnitine CoA-transferase CaiB-like acyl-CoA transferase